MPQLFQDLRQNNSVGGNSVLVVVESRGSFCEDDDCVNESLLAGLFLSKFGTFLCYDQVPCNIGKNYRKASTCPIGRSRRTSEMPRGYYNTAL